MPRESMDPDWAALSRELLNLVVERLETPKEFSLVCESWRSAAKDIQTHRADTTTPMILISSHTDKDKWHLYNPLDDKVRKTECNLGRRQRICGSSKGWSMRCQWTSNCITNKSFPYH